MGAMCLSLLLHIVVEESGSCLAAVVAIVMLGHKTTNTSNRRILSKASHLAVGLYSVVLERLQGNGLIDTLGLFGLAVDLLFTLLSSSTQSENQMECGFFLNVVVRQCPAILKLLSGKNQSLLIGRNALLVLDLGLDIVDRVRWLDVERNSLSRQGLHKDLHDCDC